MFHKSVTLLKILDVLWIKGCCRQVRLENSGLNKVKQIFLLHDFSEFSPFVFLRLLRALSVSVLWCI